MGKELAVLGCEVKVTTTGMSCEAIAITSQPSQKVKIGGKGVYFGDINVSLSAITSGSLVCASGSITITATGAKVTSSSNKVVLKGDKGTATLTFSDPSTGAQSPLPVTIEVTDAGQDKVIAL